LQRVDQLREWINLRAYAQKDPLVEYKQEAFKMFEEMNFLVRSETLEKLFKIQLVLNQPPPGLDPNQLDESGADDDDDTDDSQESAALEAEAREQLEALKPKPQRQRLVFSGGDPDQNPNGPRGGGNRSDRRNSGKEKKKKLF
jgi:preprotein translocase subunit SecA